MEPTALSARRERVGVMDGYLDPSASLQEAEQAAFGPLIGKQSLGVLSLRGIALGLMPLVARSKLCEL